MVNKLGVSGDKNIDEKVVDVYDNLDNCINTSTLVGK